MKLLAVPGTGFVETSVNKHRSDLMIVSDWVEGSALFLNQTVSRMDVRDFLCDQSYYQEQTFAMDFVDLIWQELDARNLRMGAGSIMNVDKDTVAPKAAWKDALGYTFCLMLAHLQQYSSKQHPKLFNRKYVSQGDLFERFSEESFIKLGWETLRTGWASGINTPKFTDIVDSVSKRLSENWTNTSAFDVFDTAKEEGLDLVIIRPFSDSRPGHAFYLVQCASGENWKEKLKTPDLEVWASLVVFSSRPRRGFCFPLVLDEKNFKKHCTKCGGIFVDRCRLISSGTGLTNQLSPKLRVDLGKWLTPRIKALPIA